MTSNEQRYHIRKEADSPACFAVTADNSLPLCCTPLLHQNPDRGYRGELYLTLGSGKSYPSGSSSAKEALRQELAAFSAEHVEIYQLYVYLIEFYNKPLPKEALEQLTEYMNTIHAAGKRVLLRFAYEHEGTKKGPRPKWVMAHLSQLGEWFGSNSALVNSTVYAMQLGLFGLWGEGHGCARLGMRKEKNQRQIVAQFYNIIPAGVTVMVRTPAYLQLVPERELARTTVHDDYLIGREDPWGMLPFGHPDNQALYNMARHSVTDAELPWGTNNEIAPIEPLPLLIQTKNYGLRTLSLKHNYKENKGGEGKTYYLEAWKSVYLTPEQLQANGLPCFPPACINNQISVFSYLDLHLGYLLALSCYQRQPDSLSFELINYGLGAPIDFVLVTRIDRQEEQIVPIEMKELGQYGHKHIIIPAAQNAAVFICLRHSRCPELTIHLANELDSKDGFYQLP